MVKFHPARPEVLRRSPDLQSEIEEIEGKLKALLVTQGNGKQAINFCRTDADREFTKVIMEDLDRQIGVLRMKLGSLRPKTYPR